MEIIDVDMVAQGERKEGQELSVGENAHVHMHTHMVCQGRGRSKSTVSQAPCKESALRRRGGDYKCPPLLRGQTS